MKDRAVRKYMASRPKCGVENASFVRQEQVVRNGLKRPLEEGQHFKATLKFERAGDIAVDFIVESIGA
jgi:hypothetical protein